MIFLCIITGVVIVATIVSPFFLGRGGVLAAAASQSSPEKLRALQQAVVDRFQQDEKAFDNKEISERAWKTRKHFLLNRYVDAARRLDYLEKVGAMEKKATDES